MTQNVSTPPSGEEKSKDLPAWAKYLLGGFGGALLAGGGGLWANYSEFRKDTALSNKIATEQTIAASEEIKAALDKFILIHNGKAQNSERDKEVLRKALRNAFEKAQNARNRWSGLDNQFEVYATSLTRLKEAGDNLVDAYEGGKDFMIAYSNYIVADENWRKAVQQKQGSYIASF